MEKVVIKSLFFQLTIGLCCLVLSSTLLAQNALLQTKITINAENEFVADILYKITSYYQIEFSYNSTIFKDRLKTNIDVSNVTLYHVLDILLKDKHLIYSDVNGVIVLSKNINKAVSINNEIYGFITDEATGKPIANVNIFISNTTIGTTSNMDGSYRLSTDINGVYELIFSHISYNLIVKKLNFNSLDSNDYSITMKEVTNELGEVIIESSQKEWGKNLNTFKGEFLGKTSNSGRCKILNPWVLDFNYDVETDLLTVTAQDLLLVENKSLGYKISLRLMFFKYHNEQASYLAKTKFEELSSKNRVQERKWIKNRQKAYLGSFEHFIQSLADDNLKKNGFQIAEVNSFSNSRDRRVVKSSDIIIKSGLVKQIRFSNYLEVVYKDTEDGSYTNFANSKDVQHTSYRIYAKPPRRQTSILEIITPKGYLVIESGKVADYLSFKQHGYWSWKRIADSLPFDYSQKLN